MKICPYCNQKSYSSASGKTQWLCPYCGKDITGVELQNADNFGNTASTGTGYSKDENKPKD